MGLHRPVAERKEEGHHYAVAEQKEEQTNSMALASRNIQKSFTDCGFCRRLSKSTVCVVKSFTERGGGLGSRPKKMYGERLGDGVEYHLMKPTPRR